jgi:HAD superfamily hydrolase (TIGR01549 family)
MSSIKIIFWDFDGVLMDSNAVRNLGFEKVLSDYPQDQVAKLLEFHTANGGLSRYVKFRYFFEEIRSEVIAENDILQLAQRFSSIMKDLLVNRDLLINETMDFVRRNQQNYIMHITSGSDDQELKYLCKSLQIDHLFSSIHGSPKPKKQWVKELLVQHEYKIDECVLIGDSVNDWEAANVNGIHFLAYNSTQELSALSTIKLKF